MARIHSSVSAMPASSSSVRVQLTLCPSDLGQPRHQPVGFVAVGQLVDDSAGRLDARLGGWPPPSLPARPRRRPLPAPRRRWSAPRPLRQPRLPARRSRRPARRCSPQPPPVGDRRNRGGAAGFRGGSDQLGLLELAGQRGDGVGSGLGRRELLRRVRALVGQPGKVFGERRMPPHRVVDLRDRGRAAGQLLVGGPQPVRRGGPLARWDGRFG